jgi:hypothetical protein
MTRIILPSPQFSGLTEAEIMAALNAPAPNNPIAYEVSRLMNRYAENIRAHVEQLGHIPDSYLSVKPRTEIEAVAMRLAIEAIQQQLQKR